MMMDAVPKILVVDDDEGVRFFLQEALSRDGYNVVAVDCGEAALQRIAGDTFDLALIDLKMPGISGIEVLTILRRQAPDTAVIVLTAYGSLETAVEALRQGAHDYLFKPCKAADLRQAVRAALQKQQRERRQRELLAELESTLAHNLKVIRAIAAAPAPETQPRPDAAAPAGPPRRLVVDQTRHLVTLNGQALDLSPTEFRLIAYLAAAAPRVVGARELIMQAQGYECSEREARDLVRYHIYRIRQKARCSNDGHFIVTVRGVGYALPDRSG
jgi:DNA-binding response OmpR family regulator